jgi:hypothetical protein
LSPIAANANQKDDSLFYLPPGFSEEVEATLPNLEASSSAAAPSYKAPEILLPKRETGHEDEYTEEHHPSSSLSSSHSSSSLSDQEAEQDPVPVADTDDKNDDEDESASTDVAATTAAEDYRRHVMCCRYETACRKDICSHYVHGTFDTDQILYYSKINCDAPMAVCARRAILGHCPYGAACHYRHFESPVDLTLADYRLLQKHLDYAVQKRLDSAAFATETWAADNSDS